MTQESGALKYKISGKIREIERPQGKLNPELTDLEKFQIWLLTFMRKVIEEEEQKEDDKIYLTSSKKNQSQSEFTQKMTSIDYLLFSVDNDDEALRQKRETFAEICQQHEGTFFTTVVTPCGLWACGSLLVAGGLLGTDAFLIYTAFSLILAGPTGVIPIVIVGLLIACLVVFNIAPPVIPMLSGAAIKQPFKEYDKRSADFESTQKGIKTANTTLENQGFFISKGNAPTLSPKEEDTNSLVKKL